MEQILFERPREKIQNYGSQYLTNVELLQVIIGSGGPRVPGGRLARKVNRLIEQRRISYMDLTSIYGLGAAKACQVLAAVEIGRRLAVRGVHSKHIDVPLLLRKVQGLTPGSLYCYWLDGAGTDIDVKVYPLSSRGRINTITKQVLADAIAVSARSIVIIMAVRHHNRPPTPHELSFMLSIKEAATMFRVGLAGVYVASEHGYKEWGSEL